MSEVSLSVPKRNVCKGVVFFIRSQGLNGILQFIDSKEKINDFLDYFYTKSCEVLDKDVGVFPPIIIDFERNKYVFSWYYFAECFSEWVADGMDTPENYNQPDFWKDRLYQRYGRSVEMKFAKKDDRGFLAYILNHLYGLLYVGFTQYKVSKGAKENGTKGGFGISFFVRHGYEIIGNDGVKRFVILDANSFDFEVIQEEFTSGNFVNLYTQKYNEKYGFGRVKFAEYGKEKCGEYAKSCGLEVIEDSKIKRGKIKSE